MPPGVASALSRAARRAKRGAGAGVRAKGGSRKAPTAVMSPDTGMLRGMLPPEPDRSQLGR